MFLLVVRRVVGVGGVGERLVSFSSSRGHSLSVLECLMKGCLEMLGLWGRVLEEGTSRPGLPLGGGLYGHNKLSRLATLLLSFLSLSWSNNLDCSV